MRIRKTHRTQIRTPTTRAPHSTHSDQRETHQKSEQSHNHANMPMQPHSWTRQTAPAISNRSNHTKVHASKPPLLLPLSVSTSVCLSEQQPHCLFNCLTSLCHRLRIHLSLPLTLPPHISGYFCPTTWLSIGWLSHPHATYLSHKHSLRTASLSLPVHPSVCLADQHSKCLHYNEHCPYPLPQLLSADLWLLQSNLSHMTTPTRQMKQTHSPPICLQITSASGPPHPTLGSAAGGVSP